VYIPAFPRLAQYYQNTAITAMPEYSTKSFEELRYEDMKKQAGGAGVTTQLLLKVLPLLQILAFSGL